MKSDRVMTAFSGSIPDRVPVAPKIWIDLAANILHIPYIEVLRDPALAMKTVAEAAMQLNMDAARLFVFPFRKVEKVDGKYCHVDKKAGSQGFIDIEGGWGTRLIDDDSFDISREDVMACYKFWYTYNPVINKKEDLNRMAIPDSSYYEQSGYGKMVRGVLNIAKDRLCLIGSCESGTLPFYVALRGLNQAMYDLFEQPDLIHACMEKGIEIAIGKAKFFIDQGIKVLRYNDSIANMSVISPTHWREFIFPHLKDFCDEVHRYDCEAKIYSHICGNVMPVLGDLIASGLDCIAPLDPLGGFTVSQVREKVGESVVLMGGINTLSFVNSTPEQIMAEAKQCIQQGGQKNFILGSGCMIPRDAKTENLRAVMLAAEQFGKS